MTWSSRGAGVFACSFITLFIAATTVVLRFISRGYLCRVLRPSDWVIAAALLFSVATTVTHGLQVDHGLGKHIWENPREEEVPMLKVVYINIIIYNITATLTKLSILLMFTDIFHISTTVRRISWCMIVVVSIIGVYNVLTCVFFCYPISMSWTPSSSFSESRSESDDPTTAKGNGNGNGNGHGDGDSTGAATEGWCFNKEQKYLADASVNIATDFVIWALPFPVVRGMKSLGRKERGWLFGVFGVGFFICIVSIIRLYSLKLSATSTDPSYDNAPVTCWSAVELNVSITIACLMTLKPLLARLLPRLVHDNNLPADGAGAGDRDSPHERRLKQRQRQMKGRNGNGARLQKKRRLSESLGQAAAGAGRRMSGGVMSVMSGNHGRRNSQGFGFVEMRDWDHETVMDTNFSSEHPATISSPPPRRGKAGKGGYGSTSESTGHRHRPMGREEEEVLGMTGLSSLNGSRWEDDEAGSDAGGSWPTTSTGRDEHGKEGDGQGRIGPGQEMGKELDLGEGRGGTGWRRGAGMGRGS